MAWGPSGDLFSALALILGALLLLPQAAWLFRAGRFERFLLLASLAAAGLSAGYVSEYLRGGPRIIDATSYYLEAKALSRGMLSWPASDPTEAGRFLVRDTLGSGQHLAVIFPPGYPAVLALGHWLGAPMMVGPALAFALTWLTGFLASAPQISRPGEQLLPRLAVLLSVVCAALRYHTADTMSHGLAAACFAGGLGFALRFAHSGKARTLMAAAAFAGLCVCARPVSGAVLTLLIALVTFRRWSVRSLAGAILCAAPFLGLLLLHQRAATGAWWSSSQSLYYLQADGPPGCFRYGFGEGIGCVHEHGEFVRHNLPDGYGFSAALKTTGRRLWQHGVDALNAEPLTWLLLVPALWSALGAASPRLLAAAPIGLVCSYAPFYFDGNYPGGGARFFADALPVEHVIVAWFVVHRLLPRRPWAAALPRLLLAASLFAFGLRGHNDHAALRDREGGRPMFEAGSLDAFAVEPSLLFVDTDHGFGLAFDPGGPLRVARHRGDDLDWLAWQALGAPPAFRHHYDVSTGEAMLWQVVPKRTGLIAGANLWPPVAQQHAVGEPIRAVQTCVGERSPLRVTATSAQPARVTLELPSGLAGAQIQPVVSRGAPSLLLLANGETVHRWAHVAACRAPTAFTVPADARELRLLVDSNDSLIELAFLKITP